MEVKQWVNSLNLSSWMLVHFLRSSKNFKFSNFYLNLRAESDVFDNINGKLLKELNEMKRTVSLILLKMSSNYCNANFKLKKRHRNFFTI